MLLPTNIATGRVTGQFLAGVVDGVDDDQDPDAIPASGFVTFTASVPYLPDPTAAPNPATILTTSVVAVLDNEGYLCTPAQGTLEPSYRGVRLIATDDPDLSVEGWTWNATYSFSTVAGQKLAIPTHSFAVPSGGAVDLTTVVKVPSSAGIGTEQAEALAASAQAAAIQSAQDAATAAQAAVDAAAAAQVTDTGVAALVATAGSATALEVANLVDESNAGKLNTDDAVSIYQSQAALDAAAAAKVGTVGTATNTAVKAIADNSASGKLNAAEKGAANGVAPLGPDSRVPEANLPAGLAASTLGATFAGFTEVNSPTLRLDQFPTALTDALPINSTVHNMHSVVRVPGGIIYAVFWGSDMNPYVAKMKENEYPWQVVNLGTLPGNPLNAPAPYDEHNQLAMHVDGAGYIHISGNHHRVPLNYLRSTLPNEISGWETPGMVGTNELEVTYPAFVKLADGSLLFFYRDGTSSDGDLMLNKYSTVTRTWTRVGMILKGHDWLTSADDMSAYNARYAYDSTTGRVHLWWVWRDTIDISSNVDFCYMYTADNGATWQNAADATQTLPVTPANTAVKVFTGGSGHVAGGSCYDSAGNAYAALRMADGENRLYKRAGSSITYTVMGTSMGHVALVYNPNGKIYALYQGADTYAYVKQLTPTVGTPVKIFSTALPNWTPGLTADGNTSPTVRMMIAPARKVIGGTVGGILTLDITDDNLTKIANGTVVLPKFRAPINIPNAQRNIPGSYPMTPGMYYGPTGPRGNTSNAIANGTFRGQIITASKAGVIVECAVNVVTAGASGAKFRFVIYRPDGKVLAQSADVDATVTGTRSATLTCNIGKDEQYILGTLHYGSSGISAIYTAQTGNGDSRIALGNATSYFSAVRAGFQMTSIAVPAVDQAVNFLNPAPGASVASADNIPSVVIKAGDRPADWGTTPE
jgi:hypothetical protein